jgi:hypothetical protein
MARGASEGFLRSRSSLVTNSLGSISHACSGTSEIGTLYLRKDIDNWQRTVEEGVLATRAWTLQERLLAKRVIHFGDSQIFFECSRLSLSEGCVRPKDNHFDQIKLNILDKDEFYRWTDRGDVIMNSTPFARWYKCLAEYTERNITKPTDKLPAISGLAKRMQKDWPDSGDYLAGLWENDIHRGLLWTPVQNGQLKRYSEYTGPSWSWASVQGAIESDIVELESMKPESAAILLEINVDPESDDPFGKIASAFLKLETAVLPGLFMGKTEAFAGQRIRGIEGQDMHPGKDNEMRMYQLFESDPNKEGDLESLCICWFDEDPGEEPRDYDLALIGIWASLFSTKEAETEEGIQEFVLHCPDRKFTAWALIVDYVDPVSKGDALKFRRVGVAMMHNADAFEGCLTKTLKLV